MAEATGGEWHGSIPSEYQGHAALSSFKNDAAGIGNLAKSYVEASKKLSEPLIDRIDVKDPGVVLKLRQKMGVPEKPDAYGLQDQEFAGFAHKHGLTVDQAKALHGDLSATGSSRAAQRAAEQKTAREALQASTAATLKSEWGAKADEETAFMKKGLDNEKLFSKDLRAKLEESGLIHHPDLARLANRLGHFAEGGFLSGTGGSPTGEGDIQAMYAKQVEIEGKMAEMQKTKGFDAVSPQWQQLLSQRNELRTAVSKAKIAKAQQAGAA